MGVVSKVKRAVRGEVKPKTVLLETLRRGSVSYSHWRDLARLNENAKVRVRLRPKFARMPTSQLVQHFQSRSTPTLFPSLQSSSFVSTHRHLFPAESKELIQYAHRIVDDHRWQLLGFGQKSFGKEIEWRRDPLSGYEWPLEYYRNVQLFRGDGSDARVTWELNRMGHLLTLARAYKLTNDEKFSAEFFRQLQSWQKQNPYGRGVNWTCAMEVALRATNLLACFEGFRYSKQLDEQSLSLFLDLIYQHGIYIRRNLEFSYIATSNHYLSDVVGLLWLGVLLPEIEDAAEWSHFGLREMLREMDKQVVDDGADFESSTGYHRFVLELFLYSFLLCRQNKIKIPERYWSKLKAMLIYTRSYLRSDGAAPLIGDTDSGQFVPLVKRRADDHAYVLPVGAALFDDCNLKIHTSPSPELLWFCGEKAIAEFNKLPKTVSTSAAFTGAGTYIMRHEDAYFCFNASGPGINGRGSHGHNDALSFELSVGGRAFIVDPGTYVYSANLENRHRFRSTRFHSTIEVDGVEQNATEVSQPFVIGSEGAPKILDWESSQHSDRVSAFHSGYQRLQFPVIHKRTVTFDKSKTSWLIEDELSGEGEHEFKIRFHFDSGLDISTNDSAVVAKDVSSNVAIKITSESLTSAPILEAQAVSRDYGSIERSTTGCFRYVGQPQRMVWRIELLR